MWLWFPAVARARGCTTRDPSFKFPSLLCIIRDDEWKEIVENSRGGILQRLKQHMAQPPSHSRAMARLESTQRRGDSPRTPPVPTFEQLLRVEDTTRWSPRNPSHSPTVGREPHREDDHIPHKKSVLAKVREKARKWRQVLAKKKHNEDATPSWGVGLDDDDEDPEYLGAPIYETDMAPEGYNEHARQHPRAVPVISEKHALAIGVNNAPNDERSPRNGSSSAKMPIAKTLTGNEGKERAPRKFSDNKTTRPTFPPASNAAQIYYTSTPQATAPMASKTSAKLPDALEIKQTPAPGAVCQAAATTGPTAAATGDNASIGEHMWDKGVSVKEYLMNKFEPGEDERALSQIISEAISPRKDPGDAGVVEKVKDAVASFLRTEEAAEPSVHGHTVSNSSSHIPISSNPHEVVEEESHGRILQAN